MSASPEENIRKAGGTTYEFRRAKNSDGRHNTRGSRKQHAERDQAEGPGQLPPLVPKLWRYRDPATIPPREWLVGNVLIRGYATVLGSTGGVGKTALAIAMALAFITRRRDILDLHVFQTGNAWINVLEDDLDELDRRIHAAMLLHEISRKDIEGRLFINTGDERPVLLARANEAGVFEAMPRCPRP